MKAMLLPFLLLSAGCAALGGSAHKNAVVSFEDLEAASEIKRAGYECDFYRIVKNDPAGSSYCGSATEPDYVSHFVSFGYQGSIAVSSDYLANLTRSLEKDGRNVEREYASAFSSKGASGAASMLFDRAAPESFAASGEKRLGFFLSRKDVFLRKTIYPSLKIRFLQAPDDEAGKRYLSEYRIGYDVAPIGVTAKYSTEWISAYLGVPAYFKTENLFEEGGIGKILGYFSALSEGSAADGKSSDGRLSPREMSRPFVYEEKISALAKRNEESLFPSAPGANEGYLNEYLPSYELEKIEIIVKSPTGNETVLKAFDSSEIAALVASPNRSGLYFETDKISSGSLAFRFTHAARSPRIASPGYLRSNMSGLSYIYSKLAHIIVTDVYVTGYYDVRSIPADCLEKAEIYRALSKKGYGDYGAEKAAGFFKDALSDCSNGELTLTKALFTGEAPAGGLLETD